MLSRIADSLFWLNRYMERADGLLRLTYVHYILSLDKDINHNKTWKPVLEILTHAAPDEIALLENDTAATLKYLLLDTRNSNSLKTLVTKARENARGVQDHITKEVWEEVNQMFHLINASSPHIAFDANEGIRIVELFKRRSVSYTGIAEITMSRGTGWNFLNLGKYIERCLQTISLTEKQLQGISPHTENDILIWRCLLLSLSGYELHLKTYRTSNYNYNVMHQVVLNEHFTRSVLYTVTHINIYLHRVVNKENKESARLLRSFGRMYSRLKYMEPGSLNNPNLEPVLTGIKNDIFDFSKLLTEHFFSYS